MMSVYVHTNATKLGPRKSEILRTATDGRWFSAEYAGRDYYHCVKLFERGYLRRGFPDIYCFAITDAGREALHYYDREVA